MISAKRANAVRNLVSLYTVVIGAALSLAVVSLIDPKQGLDSVQSSAVYLFLAFVLTLIPFYHGALRHLDDTYLESPRHNIRDHVLIFDFLLLVGHAMAFVCLSLLLRKPTQFAFVFLSVLSVDIVWGGMTHLFANPAEKSGAEGKWTVINLVFAGALFAVLNYLDISWSSTAFEEKLAFPLLFVCALRTIVDYAFCYDFYFPQ